jgi:hypothetical protein
MLAATAVWAAVVLAGLPGAAQPTSAPAASADTEQASADDKKSDAWVQQIRGPLAEVPSLLKAERFDEVGPKCQAAADVLNSLAAKDDQPPPTLGKIRQQLEQLKTCASELAFHWPDRSKLSETAPEKLPQLLQEMQTLAEVVEAGTRLDLLGEPVTRWFRDRRSVDKDFVATVRNYRDRSAGVVRVGRALNELKSQLADDPPNESGLILKAFAALNVDLDRAEVDLRQGPSDAAADYARRQAAAIREKILLQRIDSLLLLHDRVSKRELQDVETARNADESREAGEAVSRRLKELGQLVREPLSNDQKRRLEQSTILVREGMVKAGCRTAQFTMDDLAQRAQQLFVAGPSADLAARETPLTQIDEAAEAVAKSLADLAADVPSSGETIKKDQDQIDPFRGKVQAGIALCRAHKHLASVPQSLDSRGDLDRGQAELAEADEQLKAAAAKSPEPKDLHERTRKAVEDVRRKVTDASARWEFREAQTAVEQSLKEVDRALQTRELRQARTLSVAIEKDMARVAATMASNDSLRTDARLAAVPAENTTRCGAMKQRLAESLARSRTAAGWLQLPLADHPLVPPEHGQRVLRAELLLGRRDLAEAADTIGQIERGAAETIQTQEAARLRRHLEFARAVADEDQAEFESARDRYRAVAQESDDPVLASAAGAARVRVESRMRRDEDRRQLQTRMIVCGLLAVAGLVLLGAFLWRNGKRAQLNQAERQVDDAIAAARNGDKDRRDSHLHEAAQRLIGLPANHPRVRQIRQKMENAKPREEIPRQSQTHSEVGVPSLSEIVDDVVLKGQPSMLNADTCVAWLRQAGSREDAERRSRVTAWLARALAPQPAMTPDELRWRCRLCGVCLEVLQQAGWCRMYLAAAQWWLHETPAAVETASHVEPRHIPPRIAPDVLIVHAMCCSRLHRHRDAMAALQLVRRQARDNQEIGKLFEAARARVLAGLDTRRTRNISAVVKKLLNS